MANKVISIKMDETDIEKLKKYFGFLQQTGFVMKDNLTFNGFLKHLLLDNLQSDFLLMSEIYKEMCLGFRFYNLREMKLMNSYNLDEETYELYERAISSYMTKRENEQREKAVEFFNLIDIDYVDSQGSLYSEFIPLPESIKEKDIFWETKAWEMRECIHSDNTDEFTNDIRLIKESNLSDNEKEKVIFCIKKFMEAKKAERMIKLGY